MTKAELIERVNNLTLFKETVQTARKQYWQGVTDAQRMVMECVKQLPDEPQGQDQPTAPMLQKGKDGMFYPCPMPAQQEPSPLEVALRLIESGKCPAIPTQARDMAFNLITCIRAEEARRAGK